MDKILQGLQIANEVFKIPVGVQEYRAKQADANVKSIKNESIERFQTTGEADPIAQGELNLVPAPRQPLLPGEKENPLSPKFVTKDQDEARYKKEAAFRDDYSKEVGDIDTAAIKFQNVVDGLSENRNSSKGNNSGQLKALFNGMMLFQPGVTRGADGRILNDGGGIPEEILKAYNRLLGNKNTIMTSDEERGLFQAAKSAFEARVEQAQKINERYRGLVSQEGGVRESALGLRNYSSYLQGKNAGLPSNKSKASTFTKEKQSELDALLEKAKR
jgi:hypothetical protein